MIDIHSGIVITPSDKSVIQHIKEQAEAFLGRPATLKTKVEIEWLDKEIEYHFRVGNINDLEYDMCMRWTGNVWAAYNFARKDLL